MTPVKEPSGLHRLAQLYSVQTAYYGVGRRRVNASAESLLAVLKALGAQLNSIRDVPQAIRARELSLKRRVIEPVTIAWDGAKPEILITLTLEMESVPCSARLYCDTGEKFEWGWKKAEWPVIESVTLDGRHYTAHKFIAPQKLPAGVHPFSLTIGTEEYNSIIISAPRRAFSPPNAPREWGAFLPLYALKTESDWGSGDYSGLGALADWVGGKGGKVVGTLPLLPVFLDEPYSPGPYAPVSRLFWNEFYIDITKAPEFSRCAKAREMAQALAPEIQELKQLKMVDYRRVMTLKRKVMEEMCRCLEEIELRCYAHENPFAAEYALFRAVMEKQGKPWGQWPERTNHDKWKPGYTGIQSGDYDKDVYNYYLYAQKLAAEQVKNLVAQSNRQGVKLYFDLPLGVHPDGYDTWHYRDSFVSDISVGAPPDPVFTNGQNWGFPPLHTEKIRENRYDYVHDYLRHHLQYAKMLRIDHVMGLHRLYCIPRGADSSQGVYVNYRADEMYAILSLWSHRFQSVIVGEDLGIVPGYVRSAMKRHDLNRMYILYYELADNAAHTPRAIPEKCVAGLNTHDMPPFASFWDGKDIDVSRDLNLLNSQEAAAEKKNRAAIKTALIKFLRQNKFLDKTATGAKAAFEACLAFLSASPAQTVLLNLEDLWGETDAQNVPGVGDKFPSFRRRARYALEEFCRLKGVSDILDEVKKRR